MIPWRKPGVVLSKISRGVPEIIIKAIPGEIFGVLPGVKLETVPEIISGEIYEETFEGNCGKKNPGGIPGIFP